MVRKTIKLLGRDLVLHQRFAIDVLHAMKRPSETEEEFIQNLALAISDALKENWQDLKGRKQKRVENELSPVSLLSKLTVQELVDLWEQIYKLENDGPESSENGSKKK